MHMRAWSVRSQRDVDIVGIASIHLRWRQPTHAKINALFRFLASCSANRLRFYQKCSTLVNGLLRGCLAYSERPLRKAIGQVHNTFRDDQSDYILLRHYELS